MRIFRAVPGCLGLLLALGCTTPEGFRGAGDAGGSGTGGAIGTTGTGGAFPGTGGADPGTGGGGGTTGSGGADPGTGGSGGTTGSGGAGTGGRGSGGAVVDAGRDMPSEPPADSGGDSDTRDAPDDMGSQVLTFENDCLRVRWTASASLQTAMAIGAVDGDPATEWWTATPQVGGESFQINFGGSVRLTQLVLDNTGGNQTDYPRGYNILASTDGNTFPTMVASAKPGPAGAITTINFTAATARSIRIVQTGTDPTFWWTIRELRVACQPATPPPAGAVDPLDPSHWTVTASSNVGGAGPGNAIDGDFNTRWQSGVHQQGNEWFLVDLSAPTMVSEVWLTTRLSPGDFPAQYAVEVSTNGTNYASVATGVGDVVSQITFNPVTARYVRIKQTGMTAAAGGAWWSIDELSIRP